MRRFLSSLTTFGLLICSQLALAQEEDASNDAPPALEYGVKIGGNLNRFSRPGITFGVNAGGFARFGLSDKAALQGELLYDLQGGGLHPISPAGSEVGGAVVTFTNRRVLLHTISLPLSLKYQPFGRASTSPYILAGANAQYIAAAIELRDVLTQSPILGDAVLINKTNVLGSDEIKRIQAGVHLGVGFDFYQNNGKTVGIELRYRQSMLNLNAVNGVFNHPLRAHLSSIYSSSININFYATL